MKLILLVLFTKLVLVKTSGNMDREQTIVRKQDEGLIDIDDIIAQISTAGQWGARARGCSRGIAAARNLTINCNVQVKLIAYEKQAMEMREVEQVEPDNKELMDCGTGIFQRTEAVLGGPSQS